MTAKEIENWNKDFPIGTPCWLELDNGVKCKTAIRSSARALLGSGDVVVMLEGFIGGWDIDRVLISD